MKYISRYAVLIVAFLGLTSVLPHLYTITFADFASNRGLTFSPVIDDFTYISIRKNKAPLYMDAAGNSYEKTDYFQIHPFRYAGNLAKWGTYPEIVAGQYTPLEELRKHIYYSGIRPKRSDIELNRIALYPLYESSGKFSRLELPNELFRISDRMEFISGETHGIIKEKSEVFTKALLDAGFRFPAKNIAGNTNPRKEYDFGYFVTDASGEIFHLKMINGKPYVRDTKKPEGVNFSYISVEENRADPSFGIFVDDSGGVWSLEKGDYSYARYDIGTINYKEQYLRVEANPVYTYLKVSDSDYTQLFVFDKANNLYKTHTEENVSTLSPFFKAAEDALFPIILRTSEAKAYKRHLHLELTERPLCAVGFSAILAIIYAGVMFYRRRNLLMTAVDSLFVLVGGIIPFGLLMLMGSERQR